MAVTRVVVVFNRFPQIAARMKMGVTEAVSRTLTEIEQDVKGGPHAAPYITGNLRRSYHREMTSPYSGEVGNDLSIAEYANYVEFGTSKMRAQPHLGPAAEAQIVPFRERVMAALRASA